jgi:hypothetical protein
MPPEKPKQLDLPAPKPAEAQEVYESVDLDKIPPMNNPGHQHDYVVEDEPSVIPGTHTEICRTCPSGRIVRD